MKTITLRTNSVSTAVPWLAKIGLAGMLALAGAGLVGCPTDPRSDYDIGFDDGFAEDEWYYAGYDDSFDTEGAFPILYEGDLIPFIDDLSYDAGYYDGVWYAYNDGYFVAYREAFIIGFSEGYDAAFAPDYLEFLDDDEHVELLNGGFDDGYNDGFSEGRVFGAFDFEAGLPFDWEDAFLDWESGTDLCFDEVGVCTGALGPVVYYEWGTNPHELKSASDQRPLRADRATPSIRATDDAAKARDDKGDDLALSDLVRPLLEDQEEQLLVSPETTARGNRELRLETTWLARINAIINAEVGKATHATRQ